MIEILRTNFLLVLFLNVLFASNFIDLCEAKKKHESVDIYDVTDSNTLDVENPKQNNFNNLSDKFSRRKNDRNRKFRKYNWMQKEVDVVNDSIVKGEDVACHRAAVWKCGHRFIRAHKFLDFIKEKSFEPKCALRTAFFVCLKETKTRFCHKHRNPHTEKFRKRLADTLWSTRACLLGVKQ